MRTVYATNHIVTQQPGSAMAEDLLRYLARAKSGDVLHLDYGATYAFGPAPIYIQPNVKVKCDNGKAIWMLPKDGQQSFPCSVELSDGNEFENISFQCAVTNGMISKLVGWTTKTGGAKARFINSDFDGREYVFYSGGLLGNCATFDHCGFRGNGHIICNQNSGGPENLIDVIDSWILNDPLAMPLGPDGKIAHRGEFQCEAVWQAGGRTRLIRCMVEMRGDPLKPGGDSFLRCAYIFDPACEGGGLIELYDTHCRMVPNHMANCFDLDNWTAPGKQTGTIRTFGGSGSGTDGAWTRATEHTHTSYEADETGLSMIPTSPGGREHGGG